MANLVEDLVLNDLHEIFSPSAYHNTASEYLERFFRLITSVLQRNPSETITFAENTMNRYDCIFKFCSSIKMIVNKLGRHYLDKEEIALFEECMDCMRQWNAVEGNLPLSLANINKEQKQALITVCQCMYVFWKDLSVWVSSHDHYPSMVMSLDDWNVPIQNEYMISFQNMLTSIPADVTTDVYSLISLSRLFFLWKGVQMDKLQKPAEEVPEMDYSQLASGMMSGLAEVMKNTPAMKNKTHGLREVLQNIAPQISQVTRGVISKIPGAEGANLNAATTGIINGLVSQLSDFEEKN